MTMLYVFTHTYPPVGGGHILKYNTEVKEASIDRNMLLVAVKHYQHHFKAVNGERSIYMAVFRTEKTEDFTIMSNYHFKDKRLSMKAKGLLSMMLSFSDDWQYSLNGLDAMSKEGLTAIRAMVQELEANDYLVRRRLRNKQGRLSSVEYDIYEIPQSKNPTPNYSASENPTQENSLQ